MFVYVLAMALAVGVVVIAAVLFRNLGRSVEDRDPDGATAGHAGAMMSALFLLVFAIAVIVPWTTADAARQNTHAEAQAIVDAYWAAAELPAPEVQRTRDQLRTYALFVRDTEWPVMKDGRLSPQGWKLLEGMRAQVSAIEAKGASEQEARGAVLGELQQISTARRQRASDAEASLPAGVLVITVLTGVAVVIFPFLAGARPRGLTIAPLIVMAALLGAGTYLAFDITHVFAGPLAVQPDAFSAILQELQRVTGTS